jgi:hypothetical protein
MSSPDRVSTKRTAAKTPVKAAPAAKAAGKGAGKSAANGAPKSAGKIASKIANKSAAPAPVRKAAAGPSSQEKADFLSALTKGITPNTAASRKVDAKKKPAASKTEAAPKVEVLRRIPAPEAVVSTPESAEALRFAATIEKMLADGDLETLQPHAQQALIAALCKYFAANTDMGNRYPALGRSAVTATDVMVMCGALLKAADLQVFELGMWQSWSN